MEPLQIYVSALTLIVSIHTLGVLSRFKRQTTFSFSEFKQRRIFEDRCREASEDENTEAKEKLENLWRGWTVVQTENYFPVRIPLSNRKIKEADRTIRDVVRMAPTDPAAIELLNDLNKGLNLATERKFTGSICAPILSAALGIGAWLLIDLWPFGMVYGAGTVLYFLSSRPPAFIHYRIRFAEQNKETIRNSGMIRFFQRSETRSSNPLSVFFSALLMPVVAPINYLRYFIFFL